MLRAWCADNLEKKMISLKNFERLQELQQQIVWQSVLELEPRTLVPEVGSRLLFNNSSFSHLKITSLVFMATELSPSKKTNDSSER